MPAKVRARSCQRPHALGRLQGEEMRDRFVTSSAMPTLNYTTTRDVTSRTFGQ
jgi:hypothetical protein